MKRRALVAILRKIIALGTAMIVENTMRALIEADKIAATAEIEKTDADITEALNLEEEGLKVPEEKDMIIQMIVDAVKILVKGRIGEETVQLIRNDEIVQINET